MILLTIKCKMVEIIFLESFVLEMSEVSTPDVGLPKIIVSVKVESLHCSWSPLSCHVRDYVEANES